jgi:hypothetical protein
VGYSAGFGLRSVPIIWCQHDAGKIRQTEDVLYSCPGARLLMLGACMNEMQVILSAQVHGRESKALDKVSPFDSRRKGTFVLVARRTVQHGVCRS